VGQRAKQYLQTYDRDEPWFCWVSFGGPHEPWDTPEPYASMYDPSAMPKPVVRSQDDQPRPQGWLDFHMERNTPGLESTDAGDMRANYAGNVSLIDDQVGEILDVIEERGELTNTVIAFTSDHGEMNGDWGLIYKMNFLNGALRVPLIVRTPETLVSGGGIENDDLVENMDVGPTLVDLAGGELEHRHFGRSLVPTITGKSSDAFHRDEALSEFRGEFMLMADHWKMAINREGETYLLFNLHDDPEETCNLAGLTEYGRTEDELRLRLLECISKTQLKEP
ncbi:MAG: sulfatase-like hydrolase/transferase, partial [Pseudomonadota bacterium]|nr:sulfatase-like hydrolase/transferase [Pseudomonadota bacterium]